MRSVLGHSLIRIHVFIRSHRSVIGLLRIARFARELCRAHSLDHFRVHGKEKLRRRFHTVSTRCRPVPLAHPFAPLIRFRVPPCLLRPRAPLRSLVRSLADFAHSITREKVNNSIAVFCVFSCSGLQAAEWRHLASADNPADF